ncbi:MAG: type IV secretory system conjugative DNA transfer family protein, partial [Pseudonocardiaceae bacterium]
MNWPLLINTAELAGLVGAPITEVPLPGLAQPGSRLLPTPTTMSTGGVTLGSTNYPGSEQRLTLQVEDRLRHSWILGPTGVGKSTLLANLAVQDMQAGHGLILIEPKGDLVADILDRVPRERVDDVIVLDPAKTDVPVGFNLLNLAKGEHAAELVTDHIVHVLHEIYKASWGPRTADVVRSSVLTLVNARAADGSAFTLSELPELLTNAGFRRFVITQPTVPNSLRSFWSWFEGLSEAERIQVIGPTMNKLRSFTTRTPLRLMLGQSDGLDLTDVFANRKILLVNLSTAELGEEGSFLIGSLLVAAIWHATLA